MKVFNLPICLWIISSVYAAPYTQEEASYNFNLNKTARNVADFYAEWPGHTYQPSPENWRMPFYSMFLDRWADGDPTNNEANGTVWEFDVHETQLRAGGDIAGFVSTLDYLESMGIKAIYIIGSVFRGLPWSYDGYSATDFTLIDKHTGTLEEWRTAVEEIHKRGMYLMLDMTVATMSDFVGAIDRFNGTSYANATAPFTTAGHNLFYKDSVRQNQAYLDFTISNKTIPCPSTPVFYTDEGTIDRSYTQITCFDDDFDHYGDMEAFGVHPNWMRQLAKFASVQDRLQDWNPSVSRKLQRFGCMLIDALDVDGFRLDKATQMTAPFLGDWSEAMRACALKRGKNNFFIPGEITGGNTYGSAFVGRGRTSDQFPDDVSYTLSTNFTDKSGGYLRADSKAALDSSAWSYTFYRYLEHFLGLSGRISGSYDVDYVSITNAVNEVLRTNDHVNAATGQIDVRHMYGMTNHDIFRWPAVTDGRIKSYLGVAMLNLLLPGIPLLYFGEEQDMLLLDNTAPNYIFGRQPMFSSVAWQTHGCYAIGSTQYDHNVSFVPAAEGCHLDHTSLDYFNPAHPVRNFHKHMYRLRELYPTLNEALTVQINGNYSLENVTLGTNQSWYQGLWSVMRRPDQKTQKFASDEDGQTIWFLYSNKPTSFSYKDWDCKQRDVSWTVPYPNLVAPYDDSTTVRNLLYPYEERKLSSSTVSYYNNKKAPFFGCMDSVDMEAFSMKIFVDTKYWKAPIPVVTFATPYHDQRIISNSSAGETVPFSIHFSDPMNCDDIISKLSLGSQTWQNITGRFSTLTCGRVVDPQPLDPIWAAPRSAWHISGQIENLYNGIHWIDLQGNYTGLNSKMTGYGGKERFLFRIGKQDNPLVFPRTANYSSSLLQEVHGDTKITLKHSAIGAKKFRYSTNFQTSWSKWIDIESDAATTVDVLPWNGTKKQKWKGTHVVVEYWAEAVRSAHHYQHSDTEHSHSRRWPHLYAQGQFNRFLYDGALKSDFEPVNDVTNKNYSWTWNFMTEWPSNISLNVWGLNADDEPDHQFIYGDVDNDFVLDRVPPTLTQTDNVISFDHAPPAPYLSWEVQVNDVTRKYWFVPRGQRWVQIIIYISFVFTPITCGILAMLLYAGAFYRVKWNKVGVKQARTGWFKMSNLEKNISYAEGAGSSTVAAAALAGGTRRKILIATLEYDIADLKIKIKIGGLGVMAQLMGNHLQHQDLIWVVPMVGDVEYPKNTLKRGEPYEVDINNSTYGVDVYYHILDNITYVMLSSPVFSKQTKSDPYPPRMDDLESAVFYSAWNQCIAKTCKRFPVDLYHINDYHGALAPLYLLPKIIPVALSLHNAEFQGLWPLRKTEERREVCTLFNTPEDICIKYVQFGNVFNLLHAGVSFLRIHQQGFGAVGVSDKYGARSLARYPIFWALKEIGKLPNPDPSDTGAIEETTSKKIEIDWDAENKRKDLKREAQEWAGLKLDPTAQLLVFVGRWSVQKGMFCQLISVALTPVGIDLIADLAPTLLEEFNVQLITIGPTVDLYGRFAAEKLAVLMEKYPGRVCSKPVFTACPPAIFSGADFALIPSRDEPFGLVAVEFGRKGALGIGCKTGGLGNMPGWWYTMNSVSASHLLSQFEAACRAALKSSEKVRAQLRARAAKQRFPVAVWVKRLDSLQSKCIHLSGKINKKNRLAMPLMEPVMDEYEHNLQSVPPNSLQPLTIETFQRKPSVLRRDFQQRVPPPFVPPHAGDDNLGGTHAGLKRTASMGSRRGPGRRAAGDNTQHGGALEALSEEEYYYSDESGSYSNSSEEAYYLRETGFDGKAPEERDFDQYLGAPNRHWDSMDPTASNSTLHMASQLQQENDEWSRRGLATGYDPRSAFAYDQSQDSDYDEDMYDDSPYVEDYPRTPMRSHVRQESVGYEDESLMDNTSTGHFLGSDPNGPYMSPRGTMNRSARLSVLSLTDLEKDSGVQQSTLKKGEIMFTDADGAAKKAFVEDLRQGISPSTSKKKLCIETFLMNAEREFFKRKKTQQIRGAKGSKVTAIDEDDDFDPNDRLRGMKRFLAMRGLGWPLYTIFMVLGQILAANAYQLTLLAGTYQTGKDIYIINGIFATMSLVWYVLYRRFPAYWTLSLPFILYAFAFAMIGLPYINRFASLKTASNLTHAASYLYAAASASGSLYFALNFGAEGGVEVKGWVIRACIVQGFQQVWSACIWYWGAGLSDKTSEVYKVYSDGVPMAVAVVVWIFGAFLFFIFISMLFGLPNYYRQAPGSIPAFYRSLYRRKLIMWFLFSQILSNFWLALPYGRSWTYLWESRQLPTWGVILLILFFFIVVWILILLVIHYFTRTHTWAPVLFALGVIAPRYFAEFWAVSTIGMYLPWAPSARASAVLSRSLWLWLTVLDSVQGAGIGIMLLSVTIRDHLAFTLICAQILGSLTTILAKAINIPFSEYLVSFSAWNITQGPGPFAKPFFWICMACQIAIPVGYFILFRKSQLAF